MSLEVANLPLRAGAQPIVKVELVRREMCEALKRWQYPTSMAIDFTAVETSSAPQKSSEKQDSTEAEASEAGAPETAEETAEGGAEESSGPGSIEDYMLDNIALFGIYKYMNRCPIIDRYELKDIISISFDKKINEPTGTGSLTLVYSKERFDRIGQGDELIFKFGYKYPNEVLDPKTGEKTREIMREAFKALVAEVKKTKREIEVSFADTGVLLEQKKSFSYVDKTVEEILVDIIENSGLKGDIRLSRKILETKVTLQAEKNKGGGGGSASGQFQKSCGRSDCPLPPSGSGKWATCTAVGPCACGSNRIAYNRCPPDCNVNKCPGDTGASTAQGGANRFPEGHFFCCDCDRDYCGCGAVHEAPWPRYLKTSCSGTSSESASGEGGESTTVQEMTIWDAIYKVLEKWENDVHVYVRGDTVYIEEIPMPEEAKEVFVAWSDHNMIHETFDMAEGKAPIVSGIRIKFADGGSKNKGNVIYDKDITKYPETRYPGIVDVTWPELDGKDAALIGKKALREVQRVESAETVTCEVLADPGFFPGSWVHVKNQPEDYTDFLYLKGISHKIQADDYTTSLEMSLWKPPAQTSGTEKKGGSGDKKKLDQILRDAAKFGYCSGCSDANCLVKRGCGDCWAMSDYLFNRLTEAGFQARVIQYATGQSPRHRTVQIYLDGQWVDIPYREYGFNQLFRTTSQRPNLTVIKQSQK